ncbi:MAG: hypothetical protein ACI80P_001534 [Flavobacteriales bacterium]
MLVLGTIYASEAYNFITIGDFYDDESTEMSSNPLTSGVIGTYDAYYFTSTARSPRVELNLVGFAQGVYPVALQSGNDCFTQKVIKQD